MEKMLLIKGKNIEVVKNAATHIGGCEVVELVKNDMELQGEPMQITGTCSTCPHFTSARSWSDRGGLVKWGTCELLGNAHVNEHKAQCRPYLESIPKLYVYKEVS